MSRRPAISSTRDLPGTVPSDVTPALARRRLHSGHHPTACLGARPTPAQPRSPQN
ncbi:hypothetical protein [Deinococcus yunweiensis]|uniref:hypothetical protein n=1 Tax=Deinococcus yunweiensis TaxID=367282 RepID=UPI00398EDAFC